MQAFLFQSKPITEMLAGYGYSQVHTIAAIGHLTHPNVTEIATAFSLTRGAVRKITKGLLETGLIEAYMLKEISRRFFQAH